MKALQSFVRINHCLFLLVLCLVVVCLNNPAEAKGMRFPVGLTFVSGWGDVVDLYEENMQAEGYDTDAVKIPVGISFNPYYEFGSGFRIGAGFGPMSYLLTSGADDNPYFFNFPVNVNIGFMFLSKSSVSPYLRGGIVHHLASGDYVEDTSPGLFGAVGVEFMRNRKVSLGIELAVDTSEIEFEKRYRNFSRVDSEEIQPYEVMISMFAAF